MKDDSTSLGKIKYIVLDPQPLLDSLTQEELMVVKIGRRWLDDDYGMTSIILYMCIKI